MSTLIVEAADPMTSVQDAGRHGAQRYGLSPSGAMDRLSLAIANRLVGNPAISAAIEIGPFGACFITEGESIRVAISGAARQVSLDGRVIPVNRSMTLAPGTRLQLGPARDGVFGYLAVEHGIPGQAVFGSLSVNARAGLGSPFPRPLRAEDRLEVGAASGRREHRMGSLAPSGGPIRVVLGPQDDEFGDAVATFFETAWHVSPTSDRMGYRLDGPAIRHLHGHNIVSDGTVNGSIQVPGNGQPIVLMPDRGTTGGYPKIATVISADLGRLAQIPAGQGFRFKAVSIAEARTAAIAMAELIARLPSRIMDVDDVSLDLEALQNANLAGNAVSAVDSETWHADGASAHGP